MNENYDKFYKEFRDSMDFLESDDLFDVMNRLVGSSKGNISLNRKLMEKVIDISWVEAIENAIIHVDNIVRNPSRTIIDEEEIVPIALSRKITVESVKHLAQHTDLIQEYDPVTGKITPSKVLNVRKEESLETYENRFVNTLIDRLYGFIISRYDKLSQVANDEEVYTLDFDTDIKDSLGNSIAIKLSIDTKKSLEQTNDQGYTIWQRVEKLKKMIEGYKGSELCTTLGNNYVRPPIMRTNAIMQNVDLRACLTLWQYILSYESAGYEINIEDTALKPEDAYINDFYGTIALNILLFRSYTDGDENLISIGKKKLKPVAPKVVKKYGRELLTGDYDIHADAVAGFVSEDAPRMYVKKIPENSDDIFGQIEKAIEIERAYYAEKEAERQALQAAAEEKERLRQEREARLEEKRRIEEEKRAERERIRAEKEAEAKRVQEMLEKRKAELEAEERERARIEAERQAKIEEERRIAEEQRRIAEEKQRIAEQKSMVRSTMGDAEGLDTVIYDKKKLVEDTQRAYGNVTGVEIDEAVAAMEEVKAAREAEAVKVDEAKAEAIAENFEHAADAIAEDETQSLIEELDDHVEEGHEIDQETVDVAAAVMSEYERNNDPRKIAAKMKIEQQRREKERKEEERAQRLKADRQYFESKSFDDIRKEYSKNPIYAFERGFMRLMFLVFGYIPKDTDNPDYKRILAERALKAEQKKKDEEARESMEYLYRKYSTDTKYQIRRDIADIKFRRKKRQEAKNKPKPQYTPPKRTEAEQAAINKQMKALYKEYHVGIIESIRRQLKAMTKEEKEREFRQALGEKQ
ncbi:MAG: DUF2357 domain-containing protein [Clostridiales bacterium]|nr:DUF2357 domain-containing protein [Clostridiales bacterium]